MDVKTAIKYGDSSPSSPGSLSSTQISRFYGSLFRKIFQQVHVDDVARAIWHTIEHGEPGGIYNLADAADSCQYCIGDFLHYLPRDYLVDP